jgi:hypothetical protein
VTMERKDPEHMAGFQPPTKTQREWESAYEGKTKSERAPNFGSSLRRVNPQKIVDIIEVRDDPSAVEKLLNQGVNVNWVHPETGLPLLHYAVGSDRIETVKLFLGRHADVGPDTHGRWPSILALQCECSDEVCDLIEAAEARPRWAFEEKIPDSDGATSRTQFILPGAPPFDRLIAMFRDEMKAKGVGASITITDDGDVTVSNATMGDQVEINRFFDQHQKEVLLDRETENSRID